MKIRHTYRVRQRERNGVEFDMFDAPSLTGAVSYFCIVTGADRKTVQHSLCGTVPSYSQSYMGGMIEIRRVAKEVV